MNFLQISRPVDPISSETIFRIAGFPINNSTILIFLIALSIIFLCFFVIRRFKLRPDKTQSAIEIIYESMENHIIKLTGSKKEAKIILPFIGALFIFIGISNLLTIVPVLTNFTWNGKSILRPPTSDFNTAFGLAAGAILIIQLASIKDYGFFGYLGRFLKFKEVYLGFKKGFSSGFLSIVEFFIGLLDIVSEIAKIISLSFRLFGNMYAGMVLTTVFLGISAYILPSALVVSGLLFAIVQAIVFGSLITIFYMLSIKPINNKIN